MKLRFKLALLAAPVASLVLITGCIFGGGGDDSARPVITQHPISVSVSLNDSATFFVGATGKGLLSYTWTKNGTDTLFDDVGADSVLQGVIDDSTLNGALIRCIVRNRGGAVVSDSAVITIVSGAPKR